MQVTPIGSPGIDRILRSSRATLVSSSLQPLPGSTAVSWL
jgi:hypothetical protein